mgnify:CR=1 FL=1|jgi:hypothetical protein
MESFGMMGLVFGLIAFIRVINLEKKLKDSGLIKDDSKSNEKKK